MKKKKRKFCVIIDYVPLFNIFTNERNNVWSFFSLFNLRSEKEVYDYKSHYDNIILFFSFLISKFSKHSSDRIGYIFLRNFMATVILTRENPEQ
jgi:hypothetical protein